LKQNQSSPTYHWLVGWVQELDLTSQVRSV
jgi:hypothetical protein